MINSAEDSPAEPEVIPISRSIVLVWICSNFWSARGVAPVKPSMALALIHSAGEMGLRKGRVKVEGTNSLNRPGMNAGVQVVMATGNAA